jgi:Spy/CpxP family protein refolding chaperone
MNGKTAGAGLAVVAALLGGLAFAQGSEVRKARRMHRADALAEYVGLSPEQRERVEALRAEHRREVEPLLSEGRTLHDKLRASLEVKNPDATAVGTAMIAVKQHRDKMKASADAFRARVKAELTPEQQQKLDAFEAARRVGRAGPGRRMGPGPGGPGFGGDFGPPLEGLDGPPDFDEEDGPPTR